MSARRTQDEASRPRLLRTALIAAVVGLIAGVIIMILVEGNPLSSANEVRYLDVTVGSISDQQDSLCWSSDPAQRDASRRCAILALDPQMTVPEEGDAVTIGLVEIAPPGVDSRTQIVYAAPATAESPSPAATGESATETEAGGSMTGATPEEGITEP